MIKRQRGIEKGENTILVQTFTLTTNNKVCCWEPVSPTKKVNGNRRPLVGERRSLTAQHSLTASLAQLTTSFRTTLLCEPVRGVGRWQRRSEESNAVVGATPLTGEPQTRGRRRGFG